MLSGLRPCVNVSSASSRDAITLYLVEELDTNIHWKGFQGHQSKVKVIARPNALLRRRLTFRRCDVEVTCLSLHSTTLKSPTSLSVCLCIHYLIKCRKTSRQSEVDAQLAVSKILRQGFFTGKFSGEGLSGEIFRGEMSSFRRILWGYTVSFWLYYKLKIYPLAVVIWWGITVTTWNLHRFQ